MSKKARSTPSSSPESVETLLARACTTADIFGSEELARGFNTEVYLRYLNERFKVPCPDCGHYPTERGDDLSAKPSSGPDEDPSTRITYYIAGRETAMAAPAPPSLKVAQSLQRYLVARYVQSLAGSGVTGVISFRKESDAEWLCTVLNGNMSVIQDSVPYVEKLNRTTALDETQKFNRNVKQLAGRVLTLIDAGITGPQNAALKSLIKKEFREQMNRVWSSEFNDNDGAECGSEKEVSLEDL